MEAFVCKNITTLVLLIEACLGLVILKFVPCNYYHHYSDPFSLDTEIDWVAYMQQVETYLSGDKNYNHYMVSTFPIHNLKGDTGPCVYGGGYIYVFSLLYKLTENGKNIMVRLNLSKTYYRKRKPYFTSCTYSACG